MMKKGMSFTSLKGRLARNFIQTEKNQSEVKFIVSIHCINALHPMGVVI